MATEKLVQNSFVNGQYDREVQSKERSDFIGQGLAKALNVVSSEKGELRKRLGTRFLHSLDGASVLVPFRKPDGDDILLVCTDGNVKGFEFKGNELQDFLGPTGAAPTFPNSGWVSDTNGDYTVVLSHSTDYTGFNNAASPYYGKGSDYVVRPTATNVTTIVQIGSTNAQLLSKLRIRWCLTCSGNHKGHYKGWVDPILQYSDDGTNWVSVETDVVNPYMGGNFQASDKTAYFASYVYGSGSSKKTENYIVSDIKNVNHLEPHTYWRVYFLKSVYNDQTYSGESLELFISDVTYVPTTMTALDIDNAFFDGELLRNIKYSQHYTQMIMACVDKDPIQLDYSPSGLTITNFAGLPVGAEKPSCVQYFQQRLWFGGFNALPTTVMGSKIDVYNDFTEQTPLEFDDYLNLKCNQLKHQISNIIGGQKVLYSFSEDGLSCVDPRSSGMIATNQSIEFNLRNRMPSSGSTPAFKDDIMLYASSDGTKLYAVDYDLITERFQVDDLAKYAKDITFDKITELHYVNDESKLIYGLLESGNMFALNYMKGAYQGFFPLDFGGFVYDICPVKVGRQYKLLMVVLRDGVWYLEEKLDCGEFIDTSDPRMTKEDKKWATYDNLENNIALDCYQNYDLGIETVSIINEEGKIATDADLSNYIDKTVMFGRTDTKDWNIYTIDAVNTLTLWTLNQDGTGRKYYTLSDTPNADDPLFDENGNRADIPGRFRIGGRGENQGHRYIITSGYSEVLDMWVDINYWEQPGQERYLIDVTLEAQRGNETQFTMAYPEFTEFEANLPSVANVAIIGDGSYFEARHPDEDRKIYLSSPCHKVTYGVVYEASAMIKLQRPYESMKSVRQINLEVQNTMHLSVGTSLDDMQVLEDINDNTHYDLTNMTMNGGYVIVPGDTPEWSKFIIMKSDKGLPFTVNAVEVIMNYSNEGGN